MPCALEQGCFSPTVSKSEPKELEKVVLKVRQLSLQVFYVPWQRWGRGTAVALSQGPCTRPVCWHNIELTDAKLYPQPLNK